jgi:hypothetical protein
LGKWVQILLENSPRVYGQVFDADDHGIYIEVHKLSGKWKCEESQHIFVTFNQMHGYVSLVEECDACDLVDEVRF